MVRLVPTKGYDMLCYGRDLDTLSVPRVLAY